MKTLLMETIHLWVYGMASSFSNMLESMRNEKIRRQIKEVKWVEMNVAIVIWI